MSEDHYFITFGQSEKSIHLYGHVTTRQTHKNQLPFSLVSS